MQTLPRIRAKTRLLNFQRVTDTESLMRSLSISVEAKANAVVGQASGSVNFSKSVSLLAEDVNISANAVVVHGTEFLIPKGTKDKLLASFATPLKIEGLNTVDAEPQSFSLTEFFHLDRTNESTPSLALLGLKSITSGEISLSQKRADLAKNNKAEFQRICGDGFVAAQIGGGSLEVLYAFGNREEKEREEISAAMSGSYAAYSMSGTVKSVVEKYSKMTTTKIFYHQLGGFGDPLPISQQELEQKIQRLPQEAKDSPRPFRITVIPYSELPNYPHKPSGTKSDIDHIASVYYQLATLRFSIDKILKYPSDYIGFASGACAHGLFLGCVFYRGVNLDDLRSLQDAIEGARKKLEDAIRACLQGKPCVYPADVPANDYGFRAQLPVRTLSFQTDVELQKARADLVNTQAAYDRHPKCAIEFLSGACNPGDPLEHPERRALRAAIGNLTQTIASLEAKLPWDVVQARYRTWIDEPARTRCAEQRNAGCFTNLEMQNLLVEMYKKAGLSPQ